MPTWTRMASSAVLVVAGWSWAALARGSGAATFSLLIAVGMTLGFLGDLFMAKLLPVSPHVLWGIGAFGLGHVAYIAAILGYGSAHGLDAAGPRFGAWLAWLLIGAVAWYFVVFRGHARGRPRSTGPRCPMRCCSPAPRASPPAWRSRIRRSYRWRSARCSSSSAI